MIAVNRVVPAFDVKIRTVADPEERMNNLGPIGLTQTRESVLGYPRALSSVSMTAPGKPATVPMPRRAATSMALRKVAVVCAVCRGSKGLA